MKINSKSITGRTEHVTLELLEQRKKKEFKIQRVRKGFLNKMPVSQDKMSKINNRVGFFLMIHLLGWKDESSVRSTGCSSK